MDNQPSVVETEKALTLIFEDILGRDCVECEDDFLSMGGNSISAMLCISRIRKVFKVEMRVADFFKDQATVKSIASEIEARRGLTSQ